MSCQRKRKLSNFEQIGFVNNMVPTSQAHLPPSLWLLRTQMAANWQRCWLYAFGTRVSTRKWKQRTTRNKANSHLSDAKRPQSGTQDDDDVDIILNEPNPP